MKTILLITLASAAACHAALVTYDGSTVGQPTWNRPIQDGSFPPSSLSSVGTAVPYEVVPFTVSQFGTYSMMSESLIPASWDNYGLLYVDTFNANQPLLNALIGNDDFDVPPVIGLAGFNYDLNPGTPYYFVTTGFENTDVGTYRLTITGPGDITLVPEPGQVAMMALTILGAAGYAVHRFRSSK
jgi:hypothetical protein